MDKTNDFVLQRVLHTASQSNLLKSKFKTEVLDEVFAKRKNISDEEKKLEKKLELKQREIEEIENLIANTLVRMSLKKDDATILTKVHAKYVDMLEETKSVYEDTEQQIQGLSEEIQWVNWMEKYSKSLKIDNLNEEKQQEFLQGLLSKIVVKSEYGYGRDKTKKVQRGHTLEFHYKLKIVEDDFQWTDKSSTPWKGEVIDGKKTEKSEKMRFVASRKKKSLNDASMSFRQSKTVGDCRVMYKGNIMEGVAVMGFVFGIMGLVAYVRLEKLIKTLKETGVLEKDYQDE